MATKLYLRDTSANAGTHSVNDLSSAMPGTDQLNNFGSRAVKDLSTTAGSSQKSLHNSTIANTTAQDGYWGKWISDPLAADITAQTWTLAGAFAESNGNSNGFFTYSIYVLKSDDTVRGFVYDNKTGLGGTEFLVDTTPALWGGKVVTVSGAAVSGVVATDRLCVEAWSIATQGMATSYFHDIAYDGATDPSHNVNTTDAASYVSTPQNGLFSGGTTFNQALTATATSTATIQRQINKPITGNVASTGSITRNVLKSLTATVTSTASLLASRTVLKTLSATATATASITRTVLKPLTGTVTSTASFTRTTLKNLTGNVTSTGSISRLVTKYLTGNATATASLVAARTVLMSLTAAVTSTASITRTVTKTLIGSVSSTASVVRTTSKTLTGNVSSTALLVSLKVALVSMTATVTTVSDIATSFIAGVGGVVSSVIDWRPMKSKHKSYHRRHGKHW